MNHDALIFREQMDVVKLRVAVQQRTIFLCLFYVQKCDKLLELSVAYQKYKTHLEIKQSLFIEIFVSMNKDCLITIYLLF